MVEVEQASWWMANNKKTVGPKDRSSELIKLFLKGYQVVLFRLFNGIIIIIRNVCQPGTVPKQYRKDA